MIDTAILVIGFLCTGIVYSLCVIEYGSTSKHPVIASTLRKKVKQGPNLHSIVFFLVITSAALSSLIATKYNQNIDSMQVNSNVVSSDKPSAGSGAKL